MRICARTKARWRQWRRRHLTPTSDAKFGFEQGVHSLRIGFAAGGFHHLTDKPLDGRGLGFRLRHLVGIGGDDVVDHLLDRTEVGDLFHAARFDQRAGVAALLQTISNRSFAILPEIVPSPIRSTMVPSWLADTGEPDMSRPSLLSRPNNSLITQLAASLPSRTLFASAASTVS